MYIYVYIYMCVYIYIWPDFIVFLAHIKTLLISANMSVNNDFLASVAIQINRFW